jgi:hypothetical protein
MFPTLLLACAHHPVAVAPTEGWKGVGFEHNAGAKCRDLEALDVGWYYDWLPSSPCDRPGFVPMVWSGWFLEGRNARELPRAGHGYDAVLAFNEPDLREQANMTVARALELWPRLEALGLRLGSPAPSQNGRAWLTEFLEGAKQRGYRVDFLALHWYGDCRDTTALETFLQAWESWGLPIWITEWSCREQDAATNLAFLERAIPMLATHPLVERVAWFAVRTAAPDYAGTPLVDARGTLTPLGEFYRSAHRDRASAAASQR